jgi:hypothetical protein
MPTDVNQQDWQIPEGDENGSSGTDPIPPITPVQGFVRRLLATLTPDTDSEDE